MSVVLVAVPDAEVGRKIARALVEERRLAACVTIIKGAESLYMWDGKLVEDAEDLLLIKTKTELLPQLALAVHELHPYDVPEFIAVPAGEVSPLYAKFVSDNTL